MKNDLLNKRDIIAYFFVAAIGALVNLIVGSLSQSWFQITYLEALVFGYLIASVVGFFLTKLFGFSNKNPTKTHREMVKFTMVAALSFIITVFGANTLFRLTSNIVGIHVVALPYSVKLVNVNQLTCQVVCMGASFVSNYVLHKKFTFYNTGFYDRLKRLLFR